MSQPKKPSVALDIVFCVLGIIILRKAQNVETGWDVAATLSGWVLVVVSMIINIRYLIYSFKNIGKKS